jgi:hypothetical protein
MDGNSSPSFEPRGKWKDADHHRDALPDGRGKAEKAMRLHVSAMSRLQSKIRLGGKLRVTALALSSYCVNQLGKAIHILPLSCSF